MILMILPFLAVLATSEAQTDCQCVPYYLCADGWAVHLHNTSVTGAGKLIDRVGNDRVCPNKNHETCCKYPIECGYRNQKGLDTNIADIHEDDAKFGEFPWLVAVMADDVYIGTGVLIHPRVVMATAHIINKHTSQPITIRAGEWDTQTDLEKLKHQDRVVDEVEIHDDFTDIEDRNRHNINDLALLRLKDPVILEPHINTICLPGQGEEFEKSASCVSSSWDKQKYGKKNIGSVRPNRLSLDYVPHKACNTQMKRLLDSAFELHDSFVCATDKCQAGGAPLMCEVDGRYMLAGLVSKGFKNCDSNMPAIYAAATSFRNYIDKQMTSWGFEPHYSTESNDIDE